MQLVRVTESVYGNVRVQAREQALGVQVIRQIRGSRRGAVAVVRRCRRTENRRASKTIRCMARDVRGDRSLDSEEARQGRSGR